MGPLRYCSESPASVSCKYVCVCTCGWLLTQELSVNVTGLWNEESTELRRALESHIVADQRLDTHHLHNNLRLETVSAQIIHFNVLHSVHYIGLHNTLWG